MIFHD
jgi:hypothetical protein